MWLNARRTQEICDRYFSTIENQDLVKVKTIDKISVVFTKWRSLRQLLHAIQHYRHVLEPVVHKIYIAWNPSLGVPNLELTRLKFLKGGPLVEIITHRYESGNNIWNPIVGLATKAVFLVDDEHLPDLEKTEMAYEAWKGNKLSLVGFFARYHTRQKLAEMDSLSPSLNETENAFSSIPAEGQGLSSSIAAGPNPLQPLSQPSGPLSIVDDQYLWIYNLTSTRRPRPYSLLSSQMLLLSSDHLFTYTCLLPERIHRFIDEQSEDGADLAMNLMVAGMASARPILVKSDFVDPESGRFAGESWALSRGQLLKELVNIFTGGTRDPLQFNSVSVTQFNRIPFKKRSIKQWNKQ